MIVPTEADVPGEAEGLRDLPDTDTDTK